MRQRSNFLIKYESVEFSSYLMGNMLPKNKKPENTCFPHITEFLENFMRNDAALKSPDDDRCIAGGCSAQVTEVHAHLETQKGRGQPTFT